MYMGRSLHIYIEHRNLEIRKIRNDFFVQVRNLLLPLSLKVLRLKERVTIFPYWLFYLPTPNKGLREQAKTNRLPPRQDSSQLFRCLVSTHWLFQNLLKSSVPFRCVTSFTQCNPVSHLGLLWHLWVTRLLCARAWTPVLMLHLTNPCAEPKGSQPN